MPPYAPLIEWTRECVLSIQLHLANYQFLFTDRAVRGLVSVFDQGGGDLDRCCACCWAIRWRWQSRARRRRGAICC